VTQSKAHSVAHVQSFNHAEQPDLTLPLAQPITLTRGPRSHLVTLMDAVRWQVPGLAVSQLLVKYTEIAQLLYF